MALTSVEEAQTRELIAQQSALLSLATSEATIISKLGATKKNLSEVSSAVALGDTDLLFVRQGTTDKSITGLVVKTGLVPADASETVKGVIEVATQSEINAGSAGVLAVTAAKLRLGFAISLATNGYISFPTWMGGLIIQWGISASMSPASSLVVTLPIPFPTACLQAFANPSTDCDFAALVITLASSQITLRADQFSGVAGTASPLRWLAIGH